MERFDVLDALGNPTGRTMEKGSKPAPGEFYLGVHAYVYDADYNFLIQRRALDKGFHAGLWDVHLGHVMAGEASADAMSRELYEEVGIQIRFTPADCIGRIRWEEEGHFADIYMKQTSFNTVGMKLDEVIGVKLIPLAGDA